MGICMLGIDHNRALLDVRALFSFTKKNTAEALEVLRGKRRNPGLHYFIYLQPHGDLGQHRGGLGRFPVRLPLGVKGSRVW